jgi:hypothetical protein
MNQSVAAFVLASIVLQMGCSDSNKVGLQAPEGGKKLVYDINNFQPQVETPEDINILLQAASTTLSDAAEENAVVTITDISEAMKVSDWRRLERAVVQFRAARRKK